MVRRCEELVVGLRRGVAWWYLKYGFALCVFITSADRRRNTHTLLLLARPHTALETHLAYLAPMTEVLLLSTYFSNNVYTPPGIVPKAAVWSAHYLYISPS